VSGSKSADTLVSNVGDSFEEANVEFNEMFGDGVSVFV
jgi:hypothetical protein